MGHVQHGIPLDLARRLIDSRDLTVAVETGTLKGDTAAELAELVPQMWTVEIDGELYESAARRFAGDNRVRVRHGPSPAVLAQIAPEVRGAALFWLDAHSLPFTDNDAQAYCPPVEEREAIRSFP